MFCLFAFSVTLAASKLLAPDKENVKKFFSHFVLFLLIRNFAAMKMMKRHVGNNARMWCCCIALACASVTMAQEIVPTATFYDRDEGEEVVLAPGESRTTQAPLTVTLEAGVDDDGGRWRAACEWRVWRTDGGDEQHPMIVRFSERSQLELTQSGGYALRLTAVFTNVADGSEVEVEAEPMTIVVSESKLTCPDGFSPNGDGINDVLHVQTQSIVRLSGGVFNRWGKKLHTFTLQNIDEGWDGSIGGGDTVPNGAYLLHIDATGSDGRHYRIRKTINVLKGYTEGEAATP